MKKRLLSIVMTLAMICALAVPAFAATTSVTIGDSAAGTYSGYQLLKITGSAVDADTGDTIYSYALNDTYTAAITAVLEDVLGATIQSDNDIISYLSDLESYGASTTLNIARALAAVLSSPDATITGGTATTLDDGYWLFVSDSDANNVILQTVCSDEGLTFDPKQNVPTVTKEVLEGTNDWGKVADYEIGDDVYFRLTGTVSSYFDAYTTYYYQFEDSMSAGLSFNDDVQVTVSTTDSSGVTTDTILSEDTSGATNYTVAYDATTNSFTVTFADLNQLYDDFGNSVLVNASTVIVIEFTAELTEDAALYDEANTNEVTLTYSNDPDDSSEYGTDDDEVLVYTYELQISKVDADDDTVGLEGAVFSLYRDAACTDPVIENVTSDTDGYLSFQGLDAGTYYLKEITAPAGYNLLADAIEITITHTLNTAGDDYDTVTFTLSDGTVLEEGSTGVYNLLTVANNKGIELPSTGGMGTVIFTVVGIIVIAGAASAYVVIRRRRA